MGIEGSEGYPFTCATNLSPREAELIRIRKPDAYLNARAYINLFEARVREGGERKRGEIKGEKETAKSRVNGRKKAGYDAAAIEGGGERNGDRE